ncbi:hypothetical protein EV182_001472 [Spiromyces aspiralis]|uniref:Uncharacterized protein n=1 Tax=Spiromyces aspiralis TaxID=68401 RepID=A0ACC1HG61_9FUNG|nr:hypothetical protein EV182_001472 [Spiromyces aspiralis]
MADRSNQEMPSRDREFEDCLPCKLVGSGALLGLAGYSLYQRSQLSARLYPTRRLGLMVFGIGLAGAGVYRLLM